MESEFRSELVELRTRVAALETKLVELSPAPAAFPPPPNFTIQPPPPVVAPAQNSPVWSVKTPETLLKWGGVALVVLGAVFAASTAISRGWIGPEVQLLAVLGLAALQIRGGHQLVEQRPSWSDALLIGGVLTLFAAFSSNLFVDLTSLGAGLVFALGAGGVGLTLASLYPTRWVGIATLAGSWFSGLWLDVFDRPQSETVVWGLILAAGGLYCGVATSSARLRLTAHLFGLTWATVSIGVNSGSGLRPTVGLTLFLAIAALVTLPGPTPPHDPELRLGVGLAPWLGLMISLALGDLDHTQLALVYFSAALVVAAASLLASGRAAGGHLVALLAGAGIAVTIALAYFLDLKVFILSMAAQGLALVTIHRKVTSSWLLLANAVALLGASATYVLATAADGWIEPATPRVLAVNAGILICLGLSGWGALSDGSRFPGGIPLLVLSLIYVGSVLVPLPQGQALVSLAWALIGIAVLVWGASTLNEGIAWTGLAVLAATVAKLMSVDLAEVDTMWLAGLFLVVGLGLVRVGLALPGLSAPDPESSVEPPGQSQESIS